MDPCSLPYLGGYWYDLSNGNTKYHSNTRVSVSTPLEKISVFQHGGSIVPRKMRLRRSTAQMVDDPYTLIVALDPNQRASGELYVDDGDSFNHRTSGEFESLRFEYAGSGTKATFKSSVTHASGKQLSHATIERIVVLGTSGPATKCTMTCDGKNALSLTTVWDGTSLVVKKPTCPITSALTINFEF